MSGWIIESVSTEVSKYVHGHVSSSVYLGNDAKIDLLNNIFLRLMWWSEILLLRSLRCTVLYCTQPMWCHRPVSCVWQRRTSHWAPSTPSRCMPMWWAFRVSRCAGKLARSLLPKYCTRALDVWYSCLLLFYAVFLNFICLIYTRLFCLVHLRLLVHPTCVAVCTCCLCWLCSGYALWVCSG